jgi:4'-phosphopantetheinyl transferase EntD
VGFVGSLAHDAQIAVAAVAHADYYLSIGIDVEPAEPLPREVLPLLGTRAELAELRGDLVEARVLFCAKEAVYKALYPLDGVFLSYKDIQVDLGVRRARTRTGWTLPICLHRSRHIVAIAALPQGASNQI